MAGETLHRLQVLHWWRPTPDLSRLRRPLLHSPRAQGRAVRCHDMLLYADRDYALHPQATRKRSGTKCQEECSITKRSEKTRRYDKEVQGQE